MAEIRQTDVSDFSEIAPIFGHPSLLLAIKHPSDDFILRSRPLTVGEDLLETSFPKEVICRLVQRKASVREASVQNHHPAILLSGYLPSLLSVLSDQPHYRIEYLDTGIHNLHCIP